MKKMPSPETHEFDERDLPMAKLEISVDVEENKGLTSDSESPTSSPTSSRSSCSSGSGGCFSRSITDEDDGDHDDNDNDNDNDDCLDDWEAMADALAADDIQKNHNQEYPVHETSAKKPEPVTIKTGQVDFRAPVSFRAWRLDDASRPQSRPNLLKQNSFPMKSRGVQFAPSSCPICCEDLDITDSSFLPCLCGYKLSFLPQGNS
ncbi:putative Zinc finger, RING/FYVE/PHD-type, CCR4-NOT transcription complex subunit 4 [Helianthus annuus]|nr:putative Zinc finger, RING/FYVE/PHD-type, CCR4-NOT transcription complex subunit 4 [Helianthus annuus]